jgi:hypothetical protein
VYVHPPPVGVLNTALESIAMSLTTMMSPVCGVKLVLVSAVAVVVTWRLE